MFELLLFLFSVLVFVLLRNFFPMKMKTTIQISRNHISANMFLLFIYFFVSIIANWQQSGQTYSILDLK